jgi:hypothetical protein
MGLKHPPQPSCPRERKVFGILNQVALIESSIQVAWKQLHYKSKETFPKKKKTK